MKNFCIKVSEIHRKNAQRAITSGGTEADALNREQTRKLRLQISDSRRDVGDLKAKVKHILPDPHIQNKYKLKLKLKRMPTWSRESRIWKPK